MRLFRVTVLLLLTLFSSMAASESLRVTLSGLQQLDNITLLDARKYSQYQAGHIPGALNFPVEWTFAHKEQDGKVVEPDRIQKILRQLGIDIDTPVVVYDDGHLADAARLFWTLEVYGLKNVKVLNAGYDSWMAKGLPSTNTEPDVAPSDYIATVNQSRIATKFSTQLATRNPNQIIIDARDIEAYQGKKSSAKRFGHIPTAINIPGSHNIQTANRQAALQSLQHLQQLYSMIPEDKKVVTYCSIGLVSSVNYLALRELGYDASVYDSSWNEWANDFNLPVTNPSGTQTQVQ